MKPEHEPTQQFLVGMNSPTDKVMATYTAAAQHAVETSRRREGILLKELSVAEAGTI